MRTTAGLLRTLIAGWACLIASFPATAQEHEAGASPAGIWQGTLEAGGMRLRIVFHVLRSDSGLTATLDSPDQGAMGIPVSSAALHGDTVTFEVGLIGGVFHGSLSREKELIAGEWKQGGGTFPLTLSHAARAVELKRPQEPRGPFPYRVEEVSYENAEAGVSLAGTLTLPRGNGPFPAALLITGSGPQDRNEELLGHKPFLVIADYLTSIGIAVLRADDRGVGRSTGRFSGATTRDFASDVHAGVAFLRSRGEVDGTRIGLIGHSEGALIAPMVAAGSSEIAFVVMLAGPGLAGHTIIEAQERLIEEANGVPAAKVAQDVQLSSDLHGVVLAGGDSAFSASKIRARLMSEIARSEKPGDGPGREKEIDRQIAVLLSPWFRFFLAYDPRPALEKVRCPVLAMGGALDLQVPAAENLQAIGDALNRGGNPDHELRLLPGLNHLFQHARTGSPDEYARIEETFSPEALDIMGTWIASHVRR